MIHLRHHGVLLTTALCRMVSMIEPTKGPALLSNLSVLQVYPALDNGHYLSTVISLSYGSVSIRRILVTYMSVSMLDFSNYLFQQRYSLLPLSSREREVLNDVA